MTFRVITIPQAEREFTEIYDYIAKRSPQGAMAWVTAFEAALASLAAGPVTHTFAPEDADHDIEIRQAFFKTRRGRTYRLLFTIRGDQVFVLHVRGPGQDLVAPDDLALPE